VTGPEIGQAFWNGGPTGKASDYANWSPNQPDDCKNLFRRKGEGYASLYGKSGL
jgi:hypothetical protein